MKKSSYTKNFYAASSLLMCIVCLGLSGCVERATVTIVPSTEASETSLADGKEGIMKDER